MPKKPTPLRAPRTFEEAVDQLGHCSVDAETGERLTVAEIAARTGDNANTLAKQFSQHDSTHPYPGRKIVRDTQATGNTVVIDFLCRSVGGVFVRLPQVVPGYEDVFEALSHVTRELGEDALAIQESLANDGEFDDQEIEKIATDVNETITRSLQLLESVKRAQGRARTPSRELRATVGEKRRAG